MIRICWLLCVLLCPATVLADDGIIRQLETGFVTLAPELKTLATLSMLSFVPVFFIAMTSFTRILIVLSLLRHALGLQQTPPNMVLLTLALFLTLFSMSPVFVQALDNGIQPYLAQQLPLDQALQASIEPFRTFMISQTREGDFAAVAAMSQTALPATPAEVPMLQLIPAFMLSELTTAFKMAFLIFIPFLLIDLVVASLLMALGMMMVPPVTVSLPLKVMVFVLIDGWALISRSLVSSFQ